MSDTAEDLSNRPIVAGSRVGWLFAAIWLIYLAYPVSAMFDGTRRVGEIVGILSLVAAFSAAYIGLAIRNRTLRYGASRTALDRPRAILLGVMVVIAAVTPILSTNTWIVLWVYIASACGSTLPMGKRNYAFFGGMAATVLMVAEAIALRTDVGLWSSVLLPSLFSGLGTIGVRRMQYLIGELRQARDEVKHLAANEERLRLARDLHDLAGHSMATVTLKAELARRLVKIDPDAAEKQVADIEQVSRQALADIREAVSGYRRPTLAVETASARTALEAAGIAFDLDPALAAGARVPGLDPEAEAALAWCLREAVTNVVRHSGATRCSVRLIEARIDGDATLTLEVTDDGDGGSPVRPHAPAFGNGLTGLRERLAPFEATLRAAPVSPRGFKLTATLPVG